MDQAAEEVASISRRANIGVVLSSFYSSSVAKLVKSFGRLGDAVESLDDFRYTKASFNWEEIVHGVEPRLGMHCNI